MPVLVPSASGGTRVTAENQFELGERRVTGEIFVGKNVELSRVVYGQQTHFVEINNFLERLHEAEAERWVPHPSLILGRVGILIEKHVAIDLHVLSRPRNIALPRPNPVSDNAIAKHIGDKLIFLAVPSEQCWT